MIFNDYFKENEEELKQKYYRNKAQQRRSLTAKHNIKDKLHPDDYFLFSFYKDIINSAGKLENFINLPHIREIINSVSDPRNPNRMSMPVIINNFKRGLDRAIKKLRLNNVNLASKREVEDYLRQIMMQNSHLDFPNKADLESTAHAESACACDANPLVSEISFADEEDYKPDPNQSTDIKPAVLYRADGSTKNIMPNSGMEFQYDELKRIVNASKIQIFPLARGSAQSGFLVVDKEAKIENKMPNPFATAIYSSFYNYDTIYGDALLCRNGQIV